MSRWKLFALASLLVSIGCFAQQPKKPKAATPAVPTWPAEPVAVFGIKLGEQLPESGIPPCGGVMARESEIKVCAMHRPSLTYASIAGFQVEHFSDGLLLIRDGVAASMVINAKQRDFQAVKALLIERYGKPTRTTVRQVQSGVGAKFTSESLIWTGRLIELTLDEREVQIDQTRVIFTHLPTAAIYESEAAEQRKANAQKM